MPYKKEKWKQKEQENERGQKRDENIISETRLVVQHGDNKEVRGRVVVQCQS